MVFQSKKLTAKARLFLTSVFSSIYYLHVTIGIVLEINSNQSKTNYCNKSANANKYSRSKGNPNRMYPIAT